MFKALDFHLIIIKYLISNNITTYISLHINTKIIIKFNNYEYSKSNRYVYYSNI